MFRVQTEKGEIAFTFTHYRDLNVEVGSTLIKDVTHCRLELERQTASGVSLCSVYDNFDRDKGRKFALVRALQNAKLDRTIRREVWNRYHARRQSNLEYAAANGTGTLATVGQ